MKKSILLVDDKPEIAKIIILYLSAFTVKYMENVVSALEWLEEGNMPDLIITDLNIPGMSGEDFLIHLKEEKKFREIPVFILSALDRDEDKKRLFAEGAHDYILKPFNPEELKVRIKGVLGE